MRSQNRPTQLLCIQTLTSAALLLLLALAATPGTATAYTGALSSTDFAILGTGNWIAGGPTTLSWAVTQNADDSWHYAYSFSHPKGETSHFILETSTSFTAANLSNSSGQFGSIEVGWHNVGSGNPGMPEALYGIKFDGARGQTTALAFDSYRVPVWGDFYSKNGRAGGHGQNAAWNAGFTLGDYDPAGPPQDGSLEYHLLVPDTAGSNTPEVPEPATWILMGSALAGSWVLQRRRRRR